MEEKRRVLYNDKYGGFTISEEAKEKLIEYGMEKTIIEKYDELIFRDHPIALKVFDEIGSYRFSGPHCKIMIEEIPKIYSFVIDEYDGLEEVILKPLKSYFIDLFNYGDIQEIIEYLEKANCLRD